MKTEKNQTTKLKTVEICLLLGAVFFLASGVVSLKTQDVLSDKVVRLHVLANSDSAEDQALKLQVRDVILNRTTEILEQSADRREAESVLRGQLLELEALAAQEIAANGYPYGVSVELADTEFPTREYEGFTLPAGEYLALRVIIGEGNGQNWWCVVFPPLCTAATSDVPVSALAAGFSEEEVQLITEEPGYILKFKTIEFWENLRKNWKTSTN